MGIVIPLVISLTLVVTGVLLISKQIMFGVFILVIASVPLTVYLLEDMEIDSNRVDKPDVETQINEK